VSITQLLKLTDHGAAAGLGAGFVAGGIVVLLVGAIRFWRWQGNMQHGVAMETGFEMWIVGLSFVVVCIIKEISNEKSTD
jgi:hypothetical protein